MKRKSLTSAVSLQVSPGAPRVVHRLEIFVMEKAWHCKEGTSRSNPLARCHRGLGEELETGAILCRGLEAARGCPSRE